MGIASWKKEFYKGRVRDAAKDDLDAINHSLLKWTGLLPENLERHGVVRGERSIQGDDGRGNIKWFYINDETCALCHQVHVVDYHSGCGDCLYHQWYTESCDANARSPYEVWRLQGNPVPMIKALENVRDKVERDVVFLKGRRGVK